MGKGNKNKGCDCCCQFAADSFGSGSSPSSPPWQVDAGSWSVSGGYLLTASSSAALKCLTANPSVTKVSVKASIIGTMSNDSVRICVDCQDKDNYKYAELVFHSTGSSRTLNIGARVSGSDSVSASVTGSLVSTLVPNSVVAVTVCLTEQNILQVLLDGTFAGDFYFTSNNGNAYVALATGTLSGQAKCTAFLASQYKSGCPTCSGGCGASDNFDRADSGSLGANWIDAGSHFSIFSNEAKCSTAGAIASPDFSSSAFSIGDPTLPTPTPYMQKVDLSCDTDGDQAGLNADTAWVLVTFGASAEVGVYNRSSQKIVGKSISAPVNTKHTLQIAWCSDGQVVVHFDGAEVLEVSQFETAYTGAGLMLGASNAGNTTFDNYSVGIGNASNSNTPSPDPGLDCPGYCFCCEPDDYASEYEALVASGPFAGSYYLQRPDSINAAAYGITYPITHNQEMGIDTCADSDPLVIAAITVTGGALWMGGGTTSAGTAQLYHGLNNPIIIDPADNFIGGDGFDHLSCEWYVNFFWPAPGATGGAIGVSYYRSGFGDCVGKTVTLNIFGNPSDYMGNYGFSPPATITVQGLA